MPEPNPIGRDEILAACLEACAAGDQQLLEQVCRERPELAADIRAAAMVLTEIRASLGSSASPTKRPPDSIGRFRVLGELGRGGMGVVFRAHDAQLDREVAVKILPDAMAASGRSAERFRREARALAQLRHPHIVAIHEVGESAGGVPFFAMDLVDGRSLAEILHRLAGTDCARLRSGDLLPFADPERGGDWVNAVVALIAKVADALQAAHEEGLTHGDVKPANILVDRQQEPHLVDFGIARDGDSGGASRSARHLGTPAYMAPEQIEAGKAIGPWTDVYALGVTLYETLTLRRPFAGDTSQQTFRLVLEDDPVEPRRFNPAIPRDVATICVIALAKEPTHRYASASAFAADLRHFLALRPIRGRRPGWLDRAGKWLRRNPWPVRLAAAASVAMAAGALAMSFHTAWATAEAQRLVQTAERLMAEVSPAIDDVARFTTARERLLAADLLRPGDVATNVRLADVAEWLATYETRRLVEAGMVRVAQLGDDTGGRSEVMELTGELLTRLDDQALRYPVGAPQGFDLGSAFHQVREARGRAHRHAVSASNHANASLAADRASVQLVGGVAGASVFLFRMQPTAVGAQRLVPTPVRAGAAAPARDEPMPGSTVLAVEEVVAGSSAAASDLRRGDLIVQIDGEPVTVASPMVFDRPLTPDGVELQVVSDGVRRAVRIAGQGRPGIAAIATAYPLVCSAANRVGSLPDCTIVVTPGSYVVVVCSLGYEDLRLPFHVRRPGQRLVIPLALVADGTSPRGFVRIAAGDFEAGGDEEAMNPLPAATRFVEDFWIGRTEVTTRDYREFLDDPRTRLEIGRARAQGRWVLVPRQRRGERESRQFHRPLWREALDGSFEPPPGWEGAHPVHAISCDDAVAYCQWRTEQARARGERWLFRLPNADEWEKAARGVDARAFPWGATFDARFCRPREPVVPDPGPVGVMQLLGDESPWGVRDLAGGAYEWCAGVVPTGEQVFRGGSWVCGDPRFFRSASFAGGQPWRISDEDGFRLVAVPVPR
jgi:formylglycine-generating enzyme required for sulfatase activity